MFGLEIAVWTNLVHFFRGVASYSSRIAVYYSFQSSLRIFFSKCCMHLIMVVPQLLQEKKRKKNGAKWKRRLEIQLCSCNTDIQAWWEVFV